MKILQKPFLLLLLLHLSLLNISSESNPNIVLVLIDDLGYGEFPLYGNDFNETPNIDQLAKEGMTFTQAYASGPVCSPSRASIHTGQYTAKHGVCDYLSENSGDYLDPALHTTINEALSASGYYTGLIGKWHLDTDFEANNGGPDKHGFDYVFGTEDKYIAGGDYFYPYDKISSITEGITNEFLTDRLFAQADSFIRDNNEKPFFLSLQTYSVHMTLDAPEVLVQKYKAKYEAKYGEGSSAHFDNGEPRVSAGTPDNPYMAAMVERIDAGIGELIATLKELSIDDNTLFILTSDNGGDVYVANNGGLRGAKTWLYEGGIRVPMIVRYPNACLADVVNETPVSFIDFYPTFMELTGASTTQDLNGKSIIPLFQEDSIDRDEIYFYYPAGASAWNDRKACVLRKGDYKLIYRYALSPDYYELYNLKNDPYEENDIFSSESSIANQLIVKLDHWMEEMAIPKWQEGEDTVFDFETAFVGAYGTHGNVIGPSNASTTTEDTDHTHFRLVNNTDKLGINTSDQCGVFKRLKTGYWWGYGWFEFDPVYIATTETNSKYLHVMVRKPISSKVCVQLKGMHNATTPEILTINTKTDEWEDLVFEIKNPGWYAKLEFKADFENSDNPPYPNRLSEDIDIYIDEIIVNDDPKPRGGEISGFQEVLIQDFETGFSAKSGTKGNDGSGTYVENDPNFYIANNPHTSGINDSDQAAVFNRKKNGNWWGYAWFEFQDIEITTVPVYLHLMVNKPVQSTVCIQVKDAYQSPTTNTGELKNNSQIYTNQWQDMVYTINTPGTYSFLEIKPDFVNQTVENDLLIYFDNIIINDDPQPRTITTNNSNTRALISRYDYTVTNDLLNITRTDNNSYCLIIYDLKGREIKKTQYNSNISQTDIGNFPSGVYVATIQANDNDFTFKFIK